MTVCGHKRIQHPKKPLYSAKGPSCRKSLKAQSAEPLNWPVESFITRTLIVSIGAEVTEHMKPAKPEQRRWVVMPSGK